jgi:exodeoxyribonuclease V alpha subunit
VLVAAWRALDHETKAYRWLTHHGFPVSLAAKVIAIYGSVPVPAEHADAAAAVGRVVWHLVDDPYRMLAFTSWMKTDAAARRLGLDACDPRRLVGAVEAVCARRLGEGHTWVSREVLRTKAANLLKLPLRYADDGIRFAVERRAVVEHAAGYQAPGAWVMERFIAGRAERMRAGEHAPEQMRLEVPLLRADVERLLDAYDETQPYALSAEQRDAVWMALTEPISLLIGGPGVGKTTVLRAVHSVAAAHGRTIHQAALAGRAAQRMREATGRHALTIAGLLARVVKAEIVLDDEPLIVLDEASMCDLTILYRLLRHCPPGVRLLLVGDPGQLPPIGPGLVFHVLASNGPGTVPRTVLTIPRRQTDASGIPLVCESIRAGTVPALTTPNWLHPHGVSFVEASAATVTDTVIDVLARLGPGREVQIIGSVKNHPGGIMEINRRMQSLHAVGGGAQLNGRFFAGDPVIVTKNDWDLGVMNGDLGIALANAEGDALRVRFDEGDKVLPAAMLEEDVDLAYAITCHKAQGSQFPAVIIPVTPSRLLDRTLLLTAVSRAQQQVVIIGDSAVFAEAVTRQPASLAREVGLGT